MLRCSVDLRDRQPVGPCNCVLAEGGGDGFEATTGAVGGTGRDFGDSETATCVGVVLLLIVAALRK
jgi:hypothetical protein